MWFATLASTHEEDRRKLKEYFTDAATRLDVKKGNYYVPLRVTLHCTGIKIALKRVILKAR